MSRVFAILAVIAFALSILLHLIGHGAGHYYVLAALVGFLLCFGIEYLWSQVVFIATFAAFVAFVLALVKLFDYPFEGALGLPATDFIDVLQRVSALTGP